MKVHLDQKYKFYSKKTISVIITSYNQVDYLKEAINSVLYQTYSPYEIIICDDGSQDSSCDLIREYESNFPNIIKGIFHKENLGISKNRNSGLNAVTGEYVTWLDGDDIFFPRKLELELDKISTSENIKWVYSQVIHIDIENHTLYKRYQQFHDGLIFYKVISLFGFAPRNPLVDFNSLKSIGFFDETMEMYEDFDLCLRLSCYFNCLYCSQPLLGYRIHANGIHKSVNQRHIENYNILRKNLNTLLKKSNVTNQKEYEKLFLFCPTSIHILSKNDLEFNHRFRLIKRAFTCFFIFPRFFIKSRLHRYLIKVFFPKYILTRLENKYS